MSPTLSASVKGRIAGVAVKLVLVPRKAGSANVGSVVDDVINVYNQGHPVICLGEKSACEDRNRYELFHG
jgi:hypothetical protein